MVDRRNFLRLGVAAAGAPLVSARGASAEQAEVLQQAGHGYSHLSGAPLTAIPSVCGQCPSRCAILGFIDEGRLVKIEGNPESIRNQGKVCAKGQAGAAKAYDPDRILFPLRRVGMRGEGEWKRISWTEALDELAGRLGRLRDEGRPEQFVFHHGWISASAEKLIDEIFLPAFGTASIVKQTCHQQSARRTALELTWGGAVDSWDFDNTKFVLNFGSNVLEADTNYVSLARRLAKSAVDRGIKIVTFDVRLSNTAANSDLWVPVKPGTDLAVVLAMCNVVMTERLYRGAGVNFLDFCLVGEDREASRATKLAVLSEHLAEYTPEWAQTVSGVSATLIADLARQFATEKPACVISSRAAAAHYNGVETERAIQMLAAITGNIDNIGGRCRGTVSDWVFPPRPEDTPEPRVMAAIKDAAQDAALSGFGAGHLVLKRIKDGGERPAVYMWYHHNPAHSGSDAQQIIAVLKDESLLPYTVAVTPFYDESAALADLILPDATYLERYDIEDGLSPNQVPEYALRQPLIEPQGEARDFKDVCCELAQRLDLSLGFESAEEFIEQACKLTEAVRRGARGLRGMKDRGVWHDKDAEPTYSAYRERVPSDVLEQDGVIVDQATGVYWNWKAAGVASESQALDAGYSGTPDAHKGYVGQQVGGLVYYGFRPSVLNKSGYFELYSPLLAARSLPGLPSYVAVPDHEGLQADDLILTTFKVNVHTVSSTGNDPWLAEIHHDNPIWINRLTAESRGLKDGDRVRVQSRLGGIEAKLRVTQAVAPSVLALSLHAGRTDGGRYAAGERVPFSIDDARHDAFIWWPAGGSWINRIIPDMTEPVSGQQSWMDTVVTLTRI